MGTTYDVIYDRFLTKITDFFILELDDNDVREWCYDLMLSTIATFPVIDHDFDNLMNDYEACFNEELSNIEVEYLACGMVYQWVVPQLNNTTLTKQYIGTKDEKFFSQSGQITQLRELQNDNLARTKKIRRDYNYRNSGYFNDN